MALLVDIEKRLGAFHLKVCFEAGNEILALLGASGCGKSMTLKCIAGVETPDRGRIVLDGKTLFDSEHKINLPPQKRRVGYLFQHYALFPNMTVRQNIAAGVRSRIHADAAVRSILQLMNLEGTELKRPHQLSGGQQQRVALARILVNEPDVLLLDEPFSALDSHLRFRLEQGLRNTLRSFGKTVILVSHNRDEAYRFSDQIAVIHDGRIDAMGPKMQLFRAPGTRSGAILTGCKNISPIRRLDSRRVLALDWDMELELDEDAAAASYVGIRMHDIAYGDGENSFLCRVEEEIENPFSYTLMLRRDGPRTAALIAWEAEKVLWQKNRSDTVRICIPPCSILLLKE